MPHTTFFYAPSTIDRRGAGATDSTLAYNLQYARSNPSVAGPTRSTADRRGRVAGKLTTLSRGSNVADDFLDNGNVPSRTTIFFPSMPDTIDLDRIAEYNVSTGFMIPDGIHIYKRTQPLYIPFSFSLHAMDREFCSRGPLSILQIAADLHSLVLPLNGAGSAGRPRVHSVYLSPEAVKAFARTTVPVGGAPTTADASASGTDPAATNKDDYSGNIMDPGNHQSASFPVTCRLDLITSDPSLSSGMGIRCVGYVREVRIKLKGPWLSGRAGVKNLPTSADFSFTFVHHPSHTNNFRVDAGQRNLLEMGMYATDVRDRLYDSVFISSDSNESFTGFGEESALTHAVRPVLDAVAGNAGRS